MIQPSLLTRQDVQNLFQPLVVHDRPFCAVPVGSCPRVNLGRVMSLERSDSTPQFVASRPQILDFARHLVQPDPQRVFFPSDTGISIRTQWA